MLDIQLKKPFYAKCLTSHKRDEIENISVVIILNITDSGILNYACGSFNHYLEEEEIEVLEEYSGVIIPRLHLKTNIINDFNKLFEFIEYIED